MSVNPFVLVVCLWLVFSPTTTAINIRWLVKTPTRGKQKVMMKDEGGETGLPDMKPLNNSVYFTL